ncbi:MAG: hypothetical protein JWO46_242 [Nocardioidaceae bacterium]|nr:hypothetical protein [Nocardioidaceae bacterium]
MAKDEPLQVPNPYRAAIVGAKSGCAPDRQTLRTALDKATAAMQGGAWVGTSGDAFAADLTGWKTDAAKAATDAETEFDEAIAGQPLKVDANSWQVHWHNLGP